MLQEVKEALRITNPDFDTEIQNLIDACKLELELSGVSLIYINGYKDKLINQAIISYCKANFGFDNPESDKFKEAYASLKNFLTIVYRE